MVGGTVFGAPFLGQHRFWGTVFGAPFLGTVFGHCFWASSRIKDSDFAYESAQMAKAQIMQQSSTAILGQANKLPQSLLRLL